MQLNFSYIVYLPHASLVLFTPIFKHHSFLIHTRSALSHFPTEDGIKLIRTLKFRAPPSTSPFCTKSPVLALVTLDMILILPAPRLAPTSSSPSTAMSICGSEEQWGSVSPARLPGKARPVSQLPPCQGIWLQSLILTCALYKFIAPPHKIWKLSGRMNSKVWSQEIIKKGGSLISSYIMSTYPFGKSRLN